MSDDFLSKASAAWRGEPADVTAVQLRLRRRRWTAHVVLAIEIIGSAIAFAVGLFFFVMASRTHELLYTLSALALIVAMPLAMTATVLARQPSLKWEDETPRSVVVTALRRAEASLKAIRIGRWGVVVVGAFVLMLWLAQVIGSVRAAGFLCIYTAASFVVCAPYLLYLHRRHRGAGGERAACLRLLGELEQADVTSEGAPQGHERDSR